MNNYNDHLGPRFSVIYTDTFGNSLAFSCDNFMAQPGTHFAWSYINLMLMLAIVSSLSHTIDSKTFFIFSSL